MNEYGGRPLSEKFPVRISTDTSLVLRFALFWDFIQHRVVIPYRRFRTTYQSHLQRTKTPRSLASSSSSFSSSSSSLAFFLDFFVEVSAETSVQDYHSTLCNITEECISDLLCGGSLKSRIFTWLISCVTAVLFQIRRYNSVFQLDYAYLPPNTLQSVTEHP